MAWNNSFSVQAYSMTRSASVNKRARLLQSGFVATLCIFCTCSLLCFFIFYGKRAHHINCGWGHLTPRWRVGKMGGDHLLFPHYCTLQRHRSSAVQLTLATLYYEDERHLQQLVGAWLALPTYLKSALVFMVIDDGSTRFPARHVLEPFRSHLHLKLIRIRAELAWNIGGARNLAVLVCPTPYILLLDADLRTSATFLTEALALVKVARRSNDTQLIFIRFQRMFSSGEEPSRPHPAAMLLSKQTYWNVGGCDEDFVGNYGYTDPHFIYKAQHTPGIKLVNVAVVINNFPSLIQETTSSETAVRRDARTNSNLFKYKLRTQSWSNTYIRFEWTEEF